MSDSGSAKESEEGMKYFYVIFFVCGAGSQTGFGHVEAILDHELTDSNELPVLLKKFRQEQSNKGKNLQTLTATSFQFLRTEQ